MPGSQPPAGWYPDTTVPGQQRYWDGRAWTPHTAPLAAWTAPAAPQLASFGQRLGAALLDGLVLGLPMGVLMGLGWALLLAGTATTFDTLDPAGPGVGGGVLAAFVVMMIAAMVAGLVVPLLYATGFEGSPRGQTVGKWLLGIRVVDGPTAGRLAPSRAFVRVLVRAFASGSVFFLGYLWMLWDEQNRTWHDLAADSRVVLATGPRPGLGELLRSWTLRP